jgi:glyoxylase-like metal-dependent hydrolase (beta-lactamase superfamily II)
MATENPLTGRLGPQIMPSGLNADTGQAFASLDALRGIDADLLLPGHGDPWTQGVAEAVRKAKSAGPSWRAAAGRAAMPSSTQSRPNWKHPRSRRGGGVPRPRCR